MANAGARAIRVLHGGAESLSGVRTQEDFATSKTHILGLWHTACWNACIDATEPTAAVKLGVTSPRFYDRRSVGDMSSTGQKLSSPMSATRKLCGRRSTSCWRHHSQLYGGDSYTADDFANFLQSKINSIRLTVHRKFTATYDHRQILLPAVRIWWSHNRRDVADRHQSSIKALLSWPHSNVVGETSVADARRAAGYRSATHLFVKVFFLRPSRMQLSDQDWRNQPWTQTTLAHTGRYLTWAFCRRSLSVLLRTGWKLTLNLSTSCRVACLPTIAYLNMPTTPLFWSHSTVRFLWKKNFVIFNVVCWQ